MTTAAQEREIKRLVEEEGVPEEQARILATTRQLDVPLDVAEMLGRRQQEPGFWYWSDAEFAPIDAAMTDWFRSRGLLVGG